MLKLTNDHARSVVVTVAAALAAAMACPAMAGSVYTWTTEGGTTAYTNDSERVPAKYKNSTKRRTLGALEDYPRLSKSRVKVVGDYSQRVHARLQHLRAGSQADSAASAPAEHPMTMNLEQGAGPGGGDRIAIPIGALGQEPVISEEFSLRTRDSIATRNVQVSQQGDRILAIRLGPKNQRKINQRMDAAATAALGSRLQLPVGPE
jgi:hypothetical protein